MHKGYQLQLPIRIDMDPYIYESKKLKCPCCGGNSWIMWLDTHDECVAFGFNSFDTDVSIDMQGIVLPCEVTAHTVDRNLAVGADPHPACIDECLKCGAVFSMFDDAKNSSDSSVPDPFSW